MKITIVFIFFIFSISLVYFKPVVQAEVLPKKEQPFLPKGTILSCPKDNKPMLEVIKDIYPGSVVFKSENFKSLDPVAKLAIGEKVPCGLVKGWVRCVHTTKGWVPKDCK